MLTIQQKAIAFGSIFFIIAVCFLFFPIFGIVMAFVSVPLMIKLFTM